jgi:hypothetical protein
VDKQPASNANVAHVAAGELGTATWSGGKAATVTPVYAPDLGRRRERLFRGSHGGDEAEDVGAWRKVPRGIAFGLLLAMLLWAALAALVWWLWH